MGKIIKFDPDRRKPGKRSWTRPEDYGASSRPAAQRRQRPPAPAPQPLAPTGRSGWQAKLAVAAIILAGVATSLYGLS